MGRIAQFKNILLLKQNGVNSSAGADQESPCYGSLATTTRNRDHVCLWIRNEDLYFDCDRLH